MAHAIGLREPWIVAQLADGQLELRRRFQCPPAVRAANHVWLVVSGLPPEIQVAVNGRSAERSDRAPTDFRSDIRGLLQVRNEVVIRLPACVARHKPIVDWIERTRREGLAAGLVRLEVE